MRLAAGCTRAAIVGQGGQRDAGYVLQVPTLVDARTYTPTGSAGLKAVRVAAAGMMTLVTMDNGRVYGMGSQTGYLQGTGVQTPNVMTPTATPALSEPSGLI